MRAEDINIVANHLDPYLHRTIIKKSYNPGTGRMADVSRSVIVDDGALPGNDPMMTGSQVATAQLLVGIPGNDSQESYWLEYGRRIHQRFVDNEPLGIRCDSCTALAYYLLRTNGCSGHISVIEQAKGNANGHWFLLVGCPPGAAISYQNNFPRGSFVVDLWGVGVKRQRAESHSLTSVIDPASCIYSCGDDSLKRKINYAGSVTVPSQASFVAETTVSGCFGDKSRSAKLKALDGMLGQYHAGTATLEQLATTFTGWINNKDKRQGDAIDSIRNATGKMAELRQSLRWLGRAV
ncbi:hypothetical protein [Dyella japonica]|uniref:hypothetical protein n=1 Tax=Dyella japonica TaxID=231455 RepID=UPI000A9C9CC8|nr:hypothetical protein [Dyella japonica]